MHHELTNFGGRVCFRHLIAGQHPVHHALHILQEEASRRTGSHTGGTVTERLSHVIPANERGRRRNDLHAPLFDRLRQQEVRSPGKEDYINRSFYTKIGCRPDGPMLPLDQAIKHKVGGCLDSKAEPDPKERVPERAPQIVNGQGKERQETKFQHAHAVNGEKGGINESVSKRLQ